MWGGPTSRGFDLSDLETCYKVTLVELCWVNTTAHLRTIHNLHPVLNDEIRRILDASLAVLARKLDLAVIQVQKLQDPRSDARPGFLHFRIRAEGAKYALYQSTLDATIRDLEEWQGRCKTTLDLNMRDPNPAIDQMLQKLRETETQEKQQSGPGAASTKGHKPTTSMASPVSLTGGIRDALQPTGTQPSTDVRALNDDVRDLARKLKHADPFAFGLLNCKGVMRVFGSPPQLDLAGFDLVFNVPEGTDATEMKSLRGLLLGREGGGAPPLSRRVRLAQELATSVSYVHTFNFVHKNICPESVLLFEWEGTSQLGRSSIVTTNRRSRFLIGFESFRSAGGKTSLMGDQDWEHNIYRYPERMGEFPAEEYRMQHDIYSLGVCLLEIGLWEPLVEYAGDEADPTPEYGRVCREFVETENPWVLFKDYLVGLAQNELPRRMGDKYAELVLTCLTCLDKGGNFGDQGEVADADGILVGVRFIETIFGQLNEIVL
ncbi:hypothetical protein C8A01DRAFT_49154 [Parachaetomium inaequale]|uniref:Protein kinase domain-containing protein n=1 Tax=Parachaetomium inaequale TaxID=2588326 RepID=A0AAN6P9V6_9PEZI|nr:hypothetical protein C8A01DRAFT_49154 [Parachaetomium inaequale]